MAGVGRGALRPNTGGKQSFAIIALIVVIFILGINYWSVTSKNRRLLAEYDKLRKNYKICSENVNEAAKNQQDAEKKEREKDKTLEDTRRLLADERLNLDKHQRELTYCRRNLTAAAKIGDTLLSDCKASCDKRLNDLGLENQHECDTQVSQAIDELKKDQLLAVKSAVEKITHEANRNCNVLLEAELSKAQKEYQILKQQQDQVIADCRQQVIQPLKDERQIRTREQQEGAVIQPGQHLSQDKPVESAGPKNQQPPLQETQQKQSQQLQQQLNVNKSEQLQDKSKQSDSVLTNQDVNGQVLQQTQKVNRVEELKEKQLNQNVQQLSERTQQGVEAQEQQQLSAREKRQVETKVQQQQLEQKFDQRRPIDTQPLNIPSDSLLESSHRILAPSAALSPKEKLHQEETKSSQKAVELPSSSSDRRQQLPARDAAETLMQQQQSMNLLQAASRDSVPVGPSNVIGPGVSTRQTNGLENGRLGRQSVFGPEKSVDNRIGGDGYDNLNAGETRVRHVTKLSNDGIAKVELPQQSPDNEEQADVEADKVDEVAGDNDNKDDDGDDGTDGKVAEDDNKNYDGDVVNNAKVAEDNDNKDDDGDNGDDGKVAEDNDNKGDDGKDQQQPDVKNADMAVQNEDDDQANDVNQPSVR